MTPVNDNGIYNELVDDNVIYKELVSDFEFMEFEESAIDNAADANNYFESLIQMSNLHVLQESRVQKAYTDGKELGLFHFFYKTVFQYYLPMNECKAKIELQHNHVRSKVQGIRGIGNGNVNYFFKRYF